MHSRVNGRRDSIKCLLDGGRKGSFGGRGCRAQLLSKLLRSSSRISSDLYARQEAIHTPGLTSWVPTSTCMQGRERCRPQNSQLVFMQLLVRNIKSGARPNTHICLACMWLLATGPAYQHSAMYKSLIPQSQLSTAFKCKLDLPQIKLAVWAEQKTLSLQQKVAEENLSWTTGPTKKSEVLQDLTADS